MIRAVVFGVVISSAVASLNFLAVGDWGGQDSSPYYTSGQKSSATGMNTVASKIGSQFVLALGDNFYNAGIKTNENDARFTNTFDNVYSGTALKTPWYVIAGNHDHSGNVTAQIQYSNHNSRWVFPSEWHSHSVSSTDGVTMDIILIDTVDIALANKNFLKVKEEDPSYFDPLPEVSKEHAGTQWAWIEAQLKASTADYVLVGGHYPVYSVCEHGNTATLITNLKPLLETYGAHYFAGHDHCQEHIQEVGSKVNYIITGMGEECCYSNSNLAKAPSNSVQWYYASNNKAKATTAGFSSVTATKTGMIVSFYDQDGALLHATPSIPPRTR